MNEILGKWNNFYSLIYGDKFILCGQPKSGSDLKIGKADENLKKNRQKAWGRRNTDTV